MSHSKGWVTLQVAPPIIIKGGGGGAVVPLQNTVSLLVGFNIKRQYSCPTSQATTTATIDRLPSPPLELSIQFWLILSFFI